MERKYANGNQTAVYNNDAEVDRTPYLTRQKSDTLLTQTGVSKVRRMARALEENCGEFSAKMGNAAREMFTRSAPRSLDQLARFNNRPVLSKYQPRAVAESPPVKCDDFRPRAQAGVRVSPATTHTLPDLGRNEQFPCDQPILMRPYVIIKETIRCLPAPVMHAPNEMNGRFSHDKHVRFRPAFEHSVSERSCWHDTSKFCSSAATVRPLTFDHILLRKSSSSPPACTDGRSGSAEQYRKSVQDNCSSESGYLSDCSLLCRPETHGDNAIVSCFQSPAPDKRYSPRSTGSSMNSSGSTPTGQAVIFTQLSFDSTLKSYYTQPAVMPGFARHTEASKRRSKKQSTSIPDNLNEQLANTKLMTSSWCNQRRDHEERNSQFLKKQPDARKEWEPQGEYHVFKKWCDSLRKYEGKNTTSRSSPSNRRSLVECAVPRPKEANDKPNAPQQSPLNLNENNAFSDQQVGALSKAVSLDCVCVETKDSPRPCEKSFPAIGKYGTTYKLDCSAKFPMLDTVREENTQADKVLLRAKPQPPPGPDHASMNRYFSEANLSMQCQMLGAQATCSDILVCKEHMPLRYKRESWLKRYGTEEAINCIPPLNQVVELEPDAEPPFERRNVVPRKNKRPEDEYTFGEFLGRGKFGEVKKCTEKKTKKELAAKFVPVRSEIDRSNVYNEVEVMNSLQHPRLLQLYEAFDCGKEIILIMELISGGELFERVIDDDFILTEMLCELYVRQICEGIEFMHKENFLHLDMKPENILCINRDGHRIKIIDFGLARRFKPGDTLRILFGTPEFVAPEVVSYEKIGQGTDLWSVGVICYVLLSGLSPFMGDNDAETYNNINHVEYDFDDESFEEISDDAKDFISKLLVLKPEDRMTATECLQHPWLSRHSNPEEPRADNVKINTRKLKRFVIRRRWQKAVNVLLALKRMGMSL